MKIGIITYHHSDNHGAMLQAYAMQSALENLGHQPSFVHLRQDSELINKFVRYEFTSVKKAALSSVFWLFRKFLKLRHERFEEFLSSELHLTRRYPNIQQLLEDPPDVDAYVCGSDQIWNLQTGMVNFFYGEYVPDGVKLISYAPSFGNVQIPVEYESKVKKLLSRFQHLAVREESGCEMLRQLTGREVTRTIDPVFLVENKIWEGLMKDSPIPQPYILFYALEVSSRASRIVSKISRILNLPVVVIAKGGSFMFSCKTKIAINSGPREFLYLLKNANFVLTNSFHATVFAIKFAVPFVTIAHSHRNTRMENLLTLAGLEDRLVNNSEELNSWSLDRLLLVNNAEAEKKLAKEIKKSYDYLASSLSKS